MILKATTGTKAILAAIILILGVITMTACGQAAEEPEPEPEPATAQMTPEAPPQTAPQAEQPATDTMAMDSSGSNGHAPTAASQSQSETTAEVTVEAEATVNTETIAESPTAQPAAEKSADMMVGPEGTASSRSNDESSQNPTGSPGPQSAPHIQATQLPPPTTATDNRQVPRDTARPGAQPMVNASQDPVSTFSLDADRASYHRALSLARQQQYIDPASVRAEEWINALDYGYQDTAGSEEFTIQADFFEHPDTPGLHMARIGFRAPEHQGPPPQVNVTLVIDTSGSMREGNRIAIAQEAARTLVQSLDDRDNVAVVKFSGNVEQVMEHRPAQEFRRNMRILNLGASGSTNVQAGLDEALWLADQIRRSNPEAVNYVILFSDGVANVNATDPFQILHNVGQDSEYSRRNPIRIITVGVGIQGYNDHLLEQIAQYGNGWYRYFDDVQQARQTFGSRNWRRIITPFADQARAQVTWNPDNVHYWRIVGYENRVTADRNFERNLREFAEIPAGASTTVLYELQLAPGAANRPNSEGILSKIAEVSVRWVTPISGEDQEQSRTWYSGGQMQPLSAQSDHLLELGVYTGLMADIYASLDQGGYGTGGTNAAIERMRKLLDWHQSLERELGRRQAYQDTALLVDEINDQAQRYWNQPVQDPPPVREGPGSGSSGYSP